MIADTNGIDCMIIRQSELGVYDTSNIKVTYSCNGKLRLKTGEEFKLQPNEKLIERTRR